MPDRKRSTVILMIGGNESEKVQARLIASCITLAKYITADLEIFVPTLRRWPTSKMLPHFKIIPRFKISITAFGREASFADEIKTALQEKQPKFFVLDKAHLVGKRTKPERLLSRKLLSDAPVPVLLMNCDKSSAKFPFLSLFVPMSGELRRSPALEWSLRFANEMDLPVDLLHVTHKFKGTTDDPSLIGKICDEFHHEYPYLVSEFVSQGSPYSSMHEKEVIRRFFHCTGLELNEIIKFGCQQARPLVVVEWKGHLEKGHAKVLKGLLDQTDWPILLTNQKMIQNAQNNKILKKPRAA